MPVYQNGEVLGLLSEKELLKPLFQGELKLSDNISLAINNNFIEINIHTVLLFHSFGSTGTVQTDYQHFHIGPHLYLGSELVKVDGYRRRKCWL